LTEIFFQLKLPNKNVYYGKNLDNNAFPSVVLVSAMADTATSPTSFPGSSLLLRKDPGWGWSRGTQILRAKIKLSLG
jgi:hypothetical protein